MNVGANLCVRPTLINCVRPALIREPTLNCLLRTMDRHYELWTGH